jgi:pimeloyl-ACP methyl ester carboxylesterase
MSEETTAPLHRSILVLVAILAVSLIIHIQVSILAQDTNIAQTAKAQKIINGTSYASSSYFVNSISAKKVKVGDIYVSYKMFGKGQPLLLIPGYSMTMDMWDPIVLDKLSSNHTIIIFDNRGIGNTTAGNKSPSIQQFANDTAGLIDALGIKKPVDILGLSMGGFIAQELTLLHPEKVNKLIIHASSCGGKESLPPQVSPKVMTSMISGNATVDIFASTLFPKEWIKQHADYIQKNIIAVPMGKVSKQSLHLQFEANSKWIGTCNRLSTITKPTLVITGSEDITSPPVNSLRIAEKIPGAWLVQIKGGGHGVMFQYPEEFTAILETFFSVT